MQLVCAEVEQGVFSAVVGRHLHWSLNGQGGVSPTTPGTASVIACNGANALLGDGSCYTLEEGTWRYVGNVAIGTAGAKSTTFGQVKATYGR